jgi:antitoxin FitA
MRSMIQIRNVPDDVHRRIKARAALAGMSMSEFLLREIEAVLERPTREEILRRLTRYPDSRPSIDSASMVREERER